MKKFLPYTLISFLFFLSYSSSLTVATTKNCGDVEADEIKLGDFSFFGWVIERIRLRRMLRHLKLSLINLSLNVLNYWEVKFLEFCLINLMRLKCH